MKKKILKKGKFFQYNDTGGRQIENDLHKLRLCFRKCLRMKLSAYKG